MEHDDQRFQALITLVTPKESGKAEKDRIKYLELTISLINAAAWPLFAFVVLWLLSGPINAISVKLPDMLKDADRVKASLGTSGVALEIQKAAQAAARQAGRPDLAERIGDLSSAAIAELIRQNVSSQIIVGKGVEPDEFTFPTSDQYKPILELEKKGLVEFGPMSFDEFNSFVKQLPLKSEGEVAERESYRATRSLTAEEMRQLSEQYYRLTAAGQEVYKFIVDSIIKEAQPAKSNSK
ncbi:MAG TPA: hypothetical protein VFD75_04510 [Pyrinomonadaceae bacterium]|nr:hypothetical protein [Pyrinomonadaceae bacterium]